MGEAALVGLQPVLDYGDEHLMAMFERVRAPPCPHATPTVRACGALLGRTPLGLCHTAWLL